MFSRWLPIFVILLVAVGCQSRPPVHFAFNDSDDDENISSMVVETTSDSAPFQWCFFGDKRLFAPDTVQGLRLNLLGGQVYSTDGIEVGLAGSNRAFLRGFQLNAFCNHAGGTVEGIQVSGLLNFCENHVQGIQVGGLTNTAEVGAEGIQIAGLSNLSGPPGFAVSIEGIQLAAIANQGRIEGIQVSLLNGFSFSLQGKKGPAPDEIQGIQLGAVNLAEDMDGIQLGALYNSAERKHGLTVGAVNCLDLNTGLMVGAVNCVEFSTGLQIGLFNCASDLTGLQIGLLNRADNAWVKWLPLFNVGH